MAHVPQRLSVLIESPRRFPVTECTLNTEVASHCGGDRGSVLAFAASAAFPGLFRLRFRAQRCRRLRLWPLG